MIENFLIQAGLRCGTVKNFANIIKEDLRLGKSATWYFKTPVSVTGSGLKSAKLIMAFPFVSIPTDENNETKILTRLEALRGCYENDLLAFLRNYKFIVPVDQANFKVVPNWANGKGDERQDRKDLAGVTAHIIEAVLTVKYRDHWINLV